MPKLNTSHLVLKQVMVNGKLAHRWVDPNTDKEFAPHGSKISFEHHGKQMTGIAGSVIKSGEYAVKGDNGITYNKHKHQFDVVGKTEAKSEEKSKVEVKRPEAVKEVKSKVEEKEESKIEAETPDKPLSEYKYNDIISLHGKNYKCVGSGFMSKTTEWEQVNSECKTYWQINNDVEETERVLNEKYTYHSPERKAKLKVTLKEAKEALKKAKAENLSPKKIEQKFMETKDPVLAAKIADPQNVVIFTPEGETKQFKGNFRFNQENKTFSLVGKLKGGKVYEEHDLSIKKAESILNKSLYKIDSDATNVRDFVNENFKEFKTDKYKEKFFDEGNGERMNEKDQEILKQLIGTSNGGVWKKLENSTITNLKEEEIDSRFSSEREGYIGMMSGDLNHIIKVSGTINGVKYQAVKQKDYDTRGFW